MVILNLNNFKPQALNKKTAVC